MSKNISPVAGAARYTHATNDDAWCVVMFDTEGFCSAVQKCKTLDSAVKAADKWQIKENKAVTKAAK